MNLSFFSNISYVCPVTRESYRLDNGQQGERESFNNFLASLRAMVKTCDYSEDCKDSIFRDCTICGIINLWRTPKATQLDTQDLLRNLQSR